MTYRESAHAETEVPPELNRSILVVGLNGIVIGIHRESGEYAWKYASLEGRGVVGIGLRYGVLVASADGPSIDRIDYLTGKHLWRRRTTSRGRATVLVEHDCIVVAKNGYLDCMDHQGKPLWSDKLEGCGLGSATLGFPGNLAQGDAEGGGAI
jgi:outer membrane protein assembly factor BamB